MDWIKLRHYSRKRQAQKNVHCASPMPGKAASAAVDRRNVQDKAVHLCRDLLSKPRQEPRAKRQIRNTNPKVLPKIQENFEVTQMDCISIEKSENRGLDMKELLEESNASSLKVSLDLHSASKGSPNNSESASEMTLPTGVSEFLLECLDSDSTVGSNAESSDGATSYSSPEIFRHESSLETNSASPEECLGCKNSTLLNTSKAIDINKMPQLPNLSKILGKPVHKILSAKEKTPKSQSPAVLLPPEKPLQCRDQQSRNLKCRKKVTFRSLLESTASSSSPISLSSAGKSSSAIHGVANEPFISKKPDADPGIDSGTVIKGRKKALLTSTAFLQPQDLELDLSSVHKVSSSGDIFPNTMDTCVNSEEIVPESLSPESTIHQCLRNPPEICCIIKASPRFRPPKVLQHPLKRKVFPPPGVTEDIITSQKNWVYNNDG
ncbi:meiosis-specific kinetochore protein isoform X2 [Hemicordylus capensis]|nr:meiosis-specific kinetochore protein isoform X2 [Hemicordylus capensis]XP_053152854.1 meiosis-specific kinetochore protein isoform X2 [Hemicordylus capensis]XP_053152855.1 meiosis-specific kinetochore protein isoform X2 [Hemicordylus capensis]XP_053152856.1 meiosis-specific kinetochore protein isoform X2 [Hemicordylus capensis]XP_053152857.1 meiosis-specific kinetochore protein isoform X2 [Hemicordylus capensis]XP_053152858.1 meiosis-specific kinetochore protein isoform X2 [Hemicordylus cap